MKLKAVIVLIIVIITGCSVNANTGIDNLWFAPTKMYVTPIELSSNERELVSLFSGMSPYMLQYAISDDVKSINFDYTDYSDSENPKTETIFGLVNDSKETLKGRIAILYDSEQARISVETNRSIFSLLKQFNKNKSNSSMVTLYLNRPYKIILNEPVPIMVVIKTNSLVSPDTKIEELINSPEIFEQFDSSYLITVTFYDKFIDSRPDH